MARSKKAAFSTYYQALPNELKDLHMFFRVATEYHQMHRPDAPGTIQERRWARDEVGSDVFCDYGPQPILKRRKRILAADREQRIARVRQRRPRAEPAPLRVDLRGGWGEVVPFPGPRQAAQPQAEPAAAEA